MCGWNLNCHIQFCRCIKVLNNIKLESAEEQAGVEIIKRALRAPSSTIIKNSGIDPTLVVEKILQAQNPNEGYDALHNQHVDMLKAGMCLSHSKFFTARVFQTVFLFSCRHH